MTSTLPATPNPTAANPWSAGHNAPEWATSLPRPKSYPAHIEASDLAELIHTKEAGKDFLVVDVRRNDWENAFVRSAINLPAQSFHQALPSLIPLLSPVPIVVFYCNSCTTTGRGPRIAAWYQDGLNERGIKTSEARILTGGIKGWVAQYGDEADLTVKLSH